MADRTAGAVYAAGVALGLGMVAYLAATRPDWVGVDYRVYERAARAALAGGPMYDAPPPGFGYTYVYPPASVVAFVPFALLPGWKLGFALFTLTELLAAAGLALVVRALVVASGGRLDRTDLLLVGAFAAGSGAATVNLFYAQVNHHLALALGAGVLALERGRARRAGALFAVPAYVKAFPAAVGVWLLRRRAWSGVAAAVGAGLAVYAAGLLLFGPEALATYLDDALLARLADDTYTGAMPPNALYVTLRRPVSQALPAAGTATRTLAVLAVLAPPLAVLYRDLSTARRRLLAAHGTLTAVLLFVPAYPVYLPYVYPTLLALPFVLAGWPRRLALGGTLLVALPVTLAPVARAVTLLAPAPAVADAALAVLSPALTLGTPPLYGLLLALAGAVLAARSSPAASAPAGTP